MSSTDTADDPFRAEVESWLRALAGATFALPVAIVKGAGRCTVRQVRTAGDLVARPARLAGSVLSLVRDARPQPHATPATAAPPAGAASPPVEVAVTDEPEPVAVTALPIEQYESLAASQVVARLSALTAGELDVVRRFEAANRARRTILGKIDQLLERA